MSVLYLLESIRMPWLDSVVSLLTRFGEEALFMAVAMFVYWCVDKYKGYYLMLVGFFGTVLNQLLKILFRIPRPWVKDPAFTIVESAREAATGYSFPSGHTQNAVGTYGSLARGSKNKILKGISIALCVIVPFTRLYLGVHTPLDVGVSIAIALVLIFAFYPIVEASRNNHKILWTLMAVLTAICLGCVIFVNTYTFPSDVDPNNLLSAKENFSKLLGAMLGMIGALYIDTKLVKFETKASFIAQLLKFVLGLAFVLALQNGLKPVMNLLFDDSPLRHILRYFIMVLFAGGIWPMTFKIFAKIKK